MECLKRALIRDDSVPIGQPAPLHLICICGTKVDVNFEHGGTCPDCHRMYEAGGWLVAGKP